MVKSLLLGGAAGFVAVAGAQAADLPVKARPAAVEYVKVCSLYGAGFYYIPGTDTCLKIGGYLRTQVESNSAGGGIAVGSNSSVQGRQDRVDSNDVQTRVRAVVTLDTRTQGEYGTLRSYYRVGWQATTPNDTLGGTGAGAYWDRAFIQFAGFTVGKAQSFFDIYHHGGARNYLNTRTSGDNGASGGMLWAYTAQFGGGFSATISLEDPIGHNLVGVSDVGFGNIFAFGYGATDNGLTNNAGGFGMQVPDIVGNLRIDQPWGYFGISAALHQVAGGYYAQNPGTICVGGANPNSVACGHPEDDWGYALGIGGQLNVPGMPGDTTGAMFRYTKGAVGYALGAGAQNWLFVDGNTVGFATTRDAFFGNPRQGYGGELELTEAMSFNAHYEHAWTPSLKTSVYGGWAQVNHSATAKNIICGGPCANGFNPDFSFWQIGSRTQWAPWKGQLNVGVDVVYTALDAARFPAGTRIVPGGAQTLGKTPGDIDNVSVMFRVQRNWYP